VPARPRSADQRQRRCAASPTAARASRDFDPATRDRFYAGSLLPAVVLAQAQRLRRWFMARAAELFRHVDVLLAPATPDVAPLLGQKTLMLGGEEVPLRPNIGIYTQPISFIGLPVSRSPCGRRGTADRRPGHRATLARIAGAARGRPP